MGEVGEAGVFFGLIALGATIALKVGEVVREKREKRAEKKRRRLVLRNQAWLEVSKLEEA